MSINSLSSTAPPPSQIQQLAHIMITQCLAVQPLEKVLIYTSTHLGLPLAAVVYQQLIDLGALPTLEIGHEASTAYFFLHGNPQQLAHFPEVAAFQTDYIDKFIQIIAPQNNSYLSGVDPVKLTRRAVVTQPIKDKKLAKPWLLTYFPTAATAQAAHLSLEQLEEFYYGAVLQDWPKVSEEMTKIASHLNQTQTIQIIGQDTDLTLKTTDHIWNDTDWQANLPGGEIFTSPVKNSAQGHIYFNFPLTNNGITMENIRLTFEKGQVVQATATKNQDHLQALLDTDEGSRYLGEVALGFNQGCNRYMDNVLFDEKMAGTIHLALGESFPECGYDNRSALHLDIIKDMSGTQDRVLADGKIIMKGGRFVKF